MFRDFASIEEESRAQVPLLRLAAGGGYLLSAATTLISLHLADPDPSDHQALTLVSAVMLSAGVLLLVLRGLPRWAIKGIGIYGGVLATATLAAVSRPLGIIPLYFVYGAMTSAYFGTRRQAIAQVVLVYVSFAAALSLSPVPLRMATYLATVSVITVVTCVVVIVTERMRRLFGLLREVASTDGLTGLLNRRAFTAAFDREIRRAGRAGLPLSLVLFDLDHFKLINDRFGHAAGDAALQRFARILIEEGRPGDIMGRVGGEEFTAGLFDCEEDGARRWAERIANRLAAETEGQVPALTTSAGVATVRSAVPQATFDEILVGADRALYAAKGAGRRCVVTVSDPGVGPLVTA